MPQNKASWLLHARHMRRMLVWVLPAARAALKLTERWLGRLACSTLAWPSKRPATWPCSISLASSASRSLQGHEMSRVSEDA